MKPIVFLAVFAASIVSADQVKPSNAGVHYVGRWDFTEPSRPSCTWQGSSFKTAFNGKGIEATLEADREEYFRVVVDENHVHSKKLKLKAGRGKYALARDLDSGDHTIEVVKETYSGKGRVYLESLEVVEGGLVAAKRVTPRLRIQFYGDSNLAGYSLEHERNKAGMQYCGCHFTFAGIASRMLGAEYHNISVSGATILGRQNSVMSFYNRMDFYEEEPKWEFDKFPADVCVVNIGANDITRRDKTQIKQNYKHLLRKLRQAHPNAHIVLMNAFGWDRNETANYTQEVVDEMADKNLTRLVFPWLFNEWHGCEYDHAGMARILTEHLATVNQEWSTIANSTVMDGFGRRGDVANGSFESVAPFGGFGWRYFEDGAVRVNDPKESPDGDWHLRIPAGGQVHQPTPATKSNTYIYRMKLRSPADGTAKIRFEFRDQQFRNEIKDAAKEFDFKLDSKWKEYSVTVDSPPGTGDKSRDVWKIILRIEATDAIVECDDVSLSRVETSAP